MEDYKYMNALVETFICEWLQLHNIVVIVKPLSKYNNWTYWMQCYDGWKYKEIYSGQCTTYNLCFALCDKMQGEVY